MFAQFRNVVYEYNDNEQLCRWLHKWLSMASSDLERVKIGYKTNYELSREFPLTHLILGGISLENSILFGLRREDIERNIKNADYYIRQTDPARAFEYLMLADTEIQKFRKVVDRGIQNQIEAASQTAYVLEFIRDGSVYTLEILIAWHVGAAYAGAQLVAKRAIIQATVNTGMYLATKYGGEVVWNGLERVSLKDIAFDAVLTWVTKYGASILSDKLIRGWTQRVSPARLGLAEVGPNFKIVKEFAAEILRDGPCKEEFKRAIVNTLVRRGIADMKVAIQIVYDRFANGKPITSDEFLEALAKENSAESWFNEWTKNILKRAQESKCPGFIALSVSMQGHVAGIKALK